MSLVSTRLPGSVRLRLAILGAAGLMLVGATGVIAAGVFNQSGPFTGCLSRIGIIYNVAQGATPLATCIRGDSVVTFSNAQGPTGPAGASGAPGKNGTNGSNGTNGNSVQPASAPTVAECPYGGLAYQIVDGNGNVIAGSREVVCNGAPGAKGDNGDTGATGPAGPAATLTTQVVHSLIGIGTNVTGGSYLACPTGTVVTGGGFAVATPFEVAPAVPMQVMISEPGDGHPADNANGWIVAAFNGSASEQWLDAYAVCVSTGS
jgi:hypothetical protein